MTDKVVSQQPAPVSGMSAKNPLGLATNEDGSREWAKGLFDCCEDPGELIMSCCCPCIVYGQQKAKLAALKNGVPYKDEGIVNSDCLIFCAVMYCYAGGVLEFVNRGEVREHYNITGDTVKDLASGCCCLPCTQVQIDRELKNEEEFLLKQN